MFEYIWSYSSPFLIKNDLICINDIFVLKIAKLSKCYLFTWWNFLFWDSFYFLTLFLTFCNIFPSTIFLRNKSRLKILLFTRGWFIIFMINLNSIQFLLIKLTGSSYYKEQYLNILFNYFQYRNQIYHFICFLYIYLNQNRSIYKTGFLIFKDPFIVELV